MCGYDKHQMRGASSERRRASNGYDKQNALETGAILMEGAHEQRMGRSRMIGDPCPHCGTIWFREGDVLRCENGHPFSAPTSADLMTMQDQSDDKE